MSKTPPPPLQPADERLEDEFVTGAYGLDGLDDSLRFYAEWAERYDERMEGRLRYVAPRVMAERLAAHLDDRSAAILDIGCGTGLTCQYLANLGFSTCDGIDVTPAMIAKSRQRGIYRDLYEADITKPLDLPDAAYDAAISSGTFTHGHVGSEAIPEIVRILKPGALLACSIHKDVWQTKGFEAAFDVLEAAGAMRAVDIHLDEFSTGLGKIGMYCVFERL